MQPNARAKTSIHFATEVVFAQFLDGEPSFLNTNDRKIKLRGNRRQGILYEKKAQEYLINKINQAGLKHIEVKTNPWIIYQELQDKQMAGSSVRYCQPDMLVIDHSEKLVRIIEIKLSHTADAFFQVRRLYEPVLRLIYDNYDFAAMEITQWYDPHVRFPESFYFEPEILNLQKGKFAINIYNPKRNGG